MDTPRRSLNVFNPNDKVAALRRESAVEPNDGVPHTTNAAEPQRPIVDEIVEAIRTVYDPEIPVNLYDLGLIYKIDLDPENRATITMTLTAPGCPVAGDLVAEVERKAETVEAVRSVRVNLVFSPPWTRERMSEAAQLELGLM